MSTASEDDASTAPDDIINFISTGSSSSPTTKQDYLSSSDAELIGGADIDVDGFCYAAYRVEQYAQTVLDFSSQFGIEYSISYTSNNICGKPTKYPEYGDFPETFAMRTYGDWWEKAPSRLNEIQPQNLPKIPAHDFIVVDFEDFVIPEEIAIYETFNPGAVIRIWAYTIAKTWVLLWECKDFFTRPLPCNNNMARRFTPPLKRIPLATRTIRLEFNHTRLNYFTEIDAVLLCGKNANIQNTQQMLEFFERRRKSTILRKVQSLQIKPVGNAAKLNSQIKEFLKHDLNKFLTELPNDETNKLTNTTIGLGDMPFEIMLNIFSYLDLISLFRVGQVSRFFYNVSTHPLLYSELSLKPYWYLTTNDLLCTLACRATILKKLDLSWCGSNNTISATEFKKFIQQRGDTLTHLRLNSCKFLNASCIETVGIVCDNLRELSLRNCETDSPLVNFSCLGNLKNLERLDLFQTMIEADLLLTMLESNRKLKHLNLAFCGIAINMDDVARYIGKYNTQLVSLDMWKSHFLSASGLQALSNCHDLEEVDLGWCLREASLGESLQQLLSNCRKMRKLFLATVRGITDRDVEHIANVCNNLEQLDLMGVLGISKERYYEVLLKCRKLQLLDLSFCDNINDSEIALWARTFKVNIKCSHVPFDLRP